MTTQQIAELETQIRHHQRLYYDMHTPAISDAEFDALWDALKASCPSSPVLNERSQYDADYKHEFPMGSLSKVKTVEEVVKKFQGRTVCITPKVDGCGLSLHYEGGRFVRAVTRGRTDTQKGKVVTANALEIKGIPKTIPGPGKVEIRGEVVIYRSVFYGIMDQPGYDGLDTGYANPRNAASGGLSCQDPAETARRNLQFIAYKTITNNGSGLFDDQNMCELTDMGFIVADPARCFEVHEVDALAEPIEWYRTIRAALPYDTDGVVIRISDAQVYNQLGMTGVCPNGAVAFKFENETAKTTIRKIECETGRLGYITPVAVFDPIQLGGATVTRACLHNFDWMTEHGNPAVGSEVVIEKCNDIIPGLKAVLTPGNGDTGMPVYCPSCGHTLQWAETLNGEGKKLKCNNKMMCPAQFSENVLNMLKVLEVKGIGPGIVESVTAAGLVKKPWEIFDLQATGLVEECGMGQVETKNICDALQNIQATPVQILAAIGVEGWGRRMFETLQANSSCYSDEVMLAGDGFRADELEAVAGVGPTRAATLASAFGPAAWGRIFLFELVKRITVTAKTVATGKLTGQSFCLSGTLPKGKKAIQAEIEAQGGAVRDSVAKGLSYLVTGEGSGSKTDKAKKLGIEIISAEQLYVMLKG